MTFDNHAEDGNGPTPLSPWFVLVCLAALATMVALVYIGATYEGPPPGIR